ncbi:hypothetical protein CK203_098733 [Vitis vinifera]|uniref:Uncharacterized protein n=1 Tax=Vitis vinifera TaxID=29760 RepID=A0A438D699_VITVI|nr:hypothetical protein CK203_098733 [Vitis vinifera]
MSKGRNQEIPRFEAWDEEDSMIMAWLWNSVTPEISDTCMLLATAKDIGMQSNRRIQKLEMRLKYMRLRVIKTKCPEDAAVLKDFIEQDRIYDFLVGLTQNLIK